MFVTPYTCCIKNIFLTPLSAVLACSEDKREPPRVTQLFLTFYLTKFKLSTWHFWFLPSAGYRTSTKHPVPLFASPKNPVATSGGCLPLVVPPLLWLWYHSENQGCCWTDPMSLHWNRELLLLLYFWRWLFASCMLLYKIITVEDDWRENYLVAISSGKKSTQQEWITQLISAPGIRVRGQRRQRLELKLKRKNLKPTDLCGRITSN